MTKKIACNDIVPGCTFKAEAASEQQLLDHVAKHAAEAHGITEVTPELLAKVRSVIQEH